MPKLLTFDANLAEKIGLWRDHVKFLSQFSEVIQLFHIPEL